jgi:hypothetical protein
MQTRGRPKRNARPKSEHRRTSSANSRSAATRPCASARGSFVIAPGSSTPRRRARAASAAGRKPARIPSARPAFIGDRIRVPTASSLQIGLGNSHQRSAAFDEPLDRVPARAALLRPSVGSCQWRRRRHGTATWIPQTLGSGTWWQSSSLVTGRVRCRATVNWCRLACGPGSRRPFRTGRRKSKSRLMQSLAPCVRPRIGKSESDSRRYNPDRRRRDLG